MISFSTKKALLLLLANAFAVNTAISADSVKQDTTTTKEVIVNANRFISTYREIGKSITLITPSAIENLPAENLESVLKMQSNIDLRQRGASGAQADLGIRGGTFDQTLVLLNGIKMSDLQTGHHNLNLPLDLESINSVEVIGGGASRVLGPNAFSGAVNFITDGKSAKYASASISGGSDNYYKFGVNANIPIANSNIYISANRAKSDGYINNTDYTLLNLYTSLSHRASFGAFALDLGYNDKAFGANSFYTPAYPDQFEKTSTKFAAFRYAFAVEDLSLNFNAYFREHNDRFELFRNGANAAAWYKSHNYHQTKTYGYSFRAGYNSFLGNTSVGFEYRNENILSNVLGTKLLTKDYVDVPNENRAKFTNAGVRNSFDVFLEHSVSIEDFSVSGGVLYNTTSAYSSHVYPGVEIAYHIDESSSIYSSYDKSLRYPTFTELYYYTSTHKGDVKLLPEESESIEFGYKYRKNAYSASAAVFYRQGSNMIDWVKELKDGKPVDGTKFQSMNIASIDAIGIELSCGMNISEIWDSAFFIKYLGLAYNYLDMKPSEVNPNYFSTYALDNLKHKFTANMDLKLPMKINMNIATIYEFRNGQYLAYQDKKATGLKDFEPHLLTNLQLSKELYGFTLSAEAYNIFDVQYIDLANLPQPGATFRLGLKYKLAE